MNYKVTFHLDGRGVVYDPFYPVHLDSLILAGSLLVYNKPGRINRETREFEELKIPVMQHTFPNGQCVYKASALLPDDDFVFEETRYFRKRFRLIEAMRMGFDKSINSTSGFFRMYNNATQILVCLKLCGYVESKDVKTLRRCLEKIGSIGSQRRMGYGKITGVEIEETKDDFTLEQDGVCARYIPHDSGLHFIRPRPPYWNNSKTTRVLLPGCKYPYKEG